MGYLYFITGEFVVQKLENRAGLSVDVKAHSFLQASHTDNEVWIIVDCTQRSGQYCHYCEAASQRAA